MDEINTTATKQFNPGQVLKAAGMAETGAEAKEVIQDGLVMVNGETETRRGRKLHSGDVVLYDGKELRIG